MPSTDVAVLLAIGLAATAWLRWLWRSGVRGRRFAMCGWLGFLGLVLIIMLLAHCLDVLSRLYVGTGYGGAAFVYDFRVYSLLLLGVVLIGTGIRLLGAAIGLSRRVPGARGTALRTLGIVLAIVAPMIPFQAFFAISLSVLSGFGLLLAAWPGELPAQRADMRETAEPRAWP
jgi:hypothetical protein